MKTAIRLIKKISSRRSMAVVGLFAVAIIFCAGFGLPAHAAPTTTPEEILDGILSPTIDVGMDLSVHMITTYLKYILVIGIVIGLFWYFKRIGKIGSR